VPHVNRDDASLFTRDGYSVLDAEWEGFTVSYEAVATESDATAVFAKLPEGACMCPHWGYMLSGKATYIFSDREETYVAGDFFYLPPGHVPTQEAGTEWVTFSPTGPHQATQSVTRAES